MFDDVVVTSEVGDVGIQRSFSITVKIGLVGSMKFIEGKSKGRNDGEMMKN